MNKAQKISPHAILLLKDTLSIAFWYKKNLAEYLKLSVKNGRDIMSKLDWKNEKKRDTVSFFIDFLVNNNANEELIYIIGDLTKKTNFNELKRSDNYHKLLLEVKQNIKELKKVYNEHANIVKEREKKADAQKKYLQDIASKNYFNQKLEELKKVFFASYALEARERGYKFEEILRALNTLFDLDPRGSYKISGEQIDGAFSLDNTDYILEAKWYTPPIDHTHIILFIEKVNTKLDNTLGLFISHSSFTETAIKKANEKNIILMDGEDLVNILENKIDYLDLLRRKKRHASETGQSFLKAKKIIIDSN